jgi:hypothetical protein
VCRREAQHLVQCARVLGHDVVEDRVQLGRHQLGDVEPGDPQVVVGEGLAEHGGQAADVGA